MYKWPGKFAHQKEKRIAFGSPFCGVLVCFFLFSLSFFFVNTAANVYIKSNESGIKMNKHSLYKIKVCVLPSHFHHHICLCTHILYAT